jgi:BirA family biotin operon repressor/biotin-[acetyl-CoA-carboxylase] ligase
MKWPNDVLITDRKACGILCEFIPAPLAVVIGMGVNLTTPRHALPTATATSLALEGADTSADDVLADFLSELRKLTDSFSSISGNPILSGIRDAALDVCGTLGSTVHVELPSGKIITGYAKTIDDQGRLVIAPPNDPDIAVAAGDIRHLTPH